MSERQSSHRGMAQRAATEGQTPSFDRHLPFTDY
jgi:hypothetical protein